MEQVGWMFFNRLARLNSKKSSFFEFSLVRKSASRWGECESAFISVPLFSLFSPFRSIPPAGYVKVGSLRYGIRISNLNLSNYPRSNKPQALSTSTPSSLIMSPSSETISAKAICNDGCCCIGSTSSKTRLPMSQSGECEKKKHFGNCPTPTRQSTYTLFFANLILNTAMFFCRCVVSWRENFPWFTVFWKLNWSIHLYVSGLLIG